jgi:hypothetical protein
MKNYKKLFKGLFSTINNVKTDKTIKSELDLVGKDGIELTSDKQLDATVFTHKYMTVKGIFLPAYMERSGLVRDRKEEFVEAKEVSELVLISKLFIDHLRKLPTTTIPENADDIFLAKDGLLYLRLSAVRKWLCHTNLKIQLSTFHKVLVELGVMVSEYRLISYYDSFECDSKTMVAWGFIPEAVKHGAN